MTLKLDELKKAVNITDLLDEDQLGRIGMKVVQGYELDEESRSEWKELVDKAMDIAKQTMESKNHPFPNSSNVKYPLITQAAIDFAARMYPVMIQNDKIVKASVIGTDPEGSKLERAERVSRHMSYQLLQESEEWEDGTDKLLHVLPVLGTVFKKTYFNTLHKRPVSELCHPDKIVVNYQVASLETARRITHILTFHKNDVIERIRGGLYRDIDVDKLASAEGHQDQDEDAPLELLEQHCYLDLDDDGYQEPYIVTVHKETHEVLRIVQRFNKIHRSSKGEVQRIDPEHYFVDYHFIRAPDSGFYSVGLGTLLYPLNAAINTLINQLIDAGTLNNTQGGFVGRGLRMKNGEFKLRLGEWRVLDAAGGTNIAQNIVPLPTKEPSGTLFQLLGLLIDVGKDLVAANDVMQGKGQTQNVPSSTVSTLLEQGMKVFNAINKRMYRSLKKEYQRIYALNRKFLKPNEYLNVLDDPKADFKADYEAESMDIVPIADPMMSTAAQRLAKAQTVMGVPGVDPYESGKYFLEALQLDESEINKVMPQPDPNAPPPPEMLKLYAEIDKLDAEAKARLTEAQVMSEKQLLDTTKLNIQRDEARVRSEESIARVVKMKQDAAVNEAKLELDGGRLDHKAMMDELGLATNKQKTDAELIIRATEVANKAKEANQKPKGD